LRGNGNQRRNEERVAKAPRKEVAFKAINLAIPIKEAPQETPHSNGDQVVVNNEKFPVNPESNVIMAKLATNTKGLDVAPIGPLVFYIKYELCKMKILIPLSRVVKNHAHKKEVSKFLGVREHPPSQHGHAQTSQSQNIASTSNMMVLQDYAPK
jgi:hypothetical protein